MRKLCPPHPRASLFLHYCRPINTPNESNFGRKPQESYPKQLRKRFRISSLFHIKTWHQPIRLKNSKSEDFDDALHQMNPSTTKRNQSSTGRRRCDPNLSYTFRKTYKERKQAIQRTNFLRKKKRRGPTPWSEANTPSWSSSSYHRHIKEKNRSFSSSNLHQKG